jgi:hypothetical protein
MPLDTFIPTGTNAVVTERRDDYQHHGYRGPVVYRDDGDILRTIKDSEAQLDRAAGDRYADTVKTVKDSEAQLDRSAGDRFMQTVEDIKDAEARLDRSSGDRFIQTVQDIKEVEIAAERSKGKLVELIKDSEFENEKAEGKTRGMLAENFRELFRQDWKGVDNIKEEIHEARRELMYHQLDGVKDNLLEFKNSQGLAYKLAAEADKTACANQTQTLLQFKEQALLSEKLAAQAARELAECCCELKSLIRDDGQKTRDLINSQEVDRLRERARRAEDGLAAYFARNVPPVVPTV